MRACARCVCLVSSGQKSLGARFPFSLFRREVFPFPLREKEKERERESERARERERKKERERKRERKRALPPAPQSPIQLQLALSVYVYNSATPSSWVQVRHCDCSIHDARSWTSTNRERQLVWICPPSSQQLGRGCTEFFQNANRTSPEWVRSSLCVTLCPGG